MAFHIQSVSQVALQARRRARAQGRWGGVGGFPLAPFTTDREMEASVSVCQHSNDVTGDTASSNNPAGPFATRPHFGLCSCGTGGRDQQCRWHSVKEKKEEGKKNNNNSCVSSSWYTNERLLRGDALLTILCKADDVIKKMSKVNFYCFPVAKVLRSHRSQSLVCAIGIC